MPWIIHAYILLALLLLASIAGGIQQHRASLEKPDKDAEEFKRLMQAGKRNFEKGMD